MAQRLPVQRINTGPQALRYRQRKLKLPSYATAIPPAASLTETFDSVTYQATGAGISHQAAPSGSWTDFIPTTTNCAVVWMSAMPGSNVSATVTIGGINAPAVSGNPFIYDATSGYNELQCFVLMNPPTGTQTVTVTFSGTNYFHATSVYYSGVGAVGNPTFVTGAAGTQPSQTVTSTLGKFYAQAFAFRPADGNSTFTTYTPGGMLALFGNPSNGYSQPLVVGDALGAGADITFSATRNNTSYPWGGVVIPLTCAPIPTRWTNWGTATTVGGMLSCIPSTNYDGGIGSVQAYDLTGDNVAIQLVQPPNVGNGGTMCSLELGPVQSGTNPALHAWSWSNGQLAASNQSGWLWWTTYDPYNHAFLRIREAGGTVYYETSPDGSSWITQTSTPATFSMSSTYVRIYSGYGGTEPDPGVALWDNLNLAPSVTTYNPTRAAGRNAGPLALRQIIRHRPQPSSPPSVSPSAKIATFTETFDTLDPTIWATVSGTPSSTYGQLTLPCASTYSTVQSVASYDLTDSSVYVNLTQTQAAGNGTTDTIFGVTSNAQYVWFQVVNGQLVTLDTTTGSTTTQPYDPIAHQFLRIRANGSGTMWWESSPDASTWIQVATSTGSGLSVGNAQVYFSCGYDGVEDNPLPAMFTDLNLPPSLPTRTAVIPVSRKTGPMALRRRIMRRQQPVYPTTRANGYIIDASLTVTAAPTGGITVDQFIDATQTISAVTETQVPSRSTVNAPFVESIGAGGFSNAGWSHTVGSRANLLVVGINNAVYGAGPPTVYCDGVAMTQMTTWNYGYVHLGNYSYLTWYYLWNPTPGVHSITTSGAGSNGNSIAIGGAAGLGPPVTSGSGTDTANTLPDQLMLNMFGGWPTGAGQEFTDYSPAAAVLWAPVATGGMPTVIGDWINETGSTTSFSATNHCGYGFGASILPIGNARYADPGLTITASTTATMAVNAVTWESTGAGGSANGGTITWTHTIGATANCVIVGVNTNTNPYNLPTVKVGSSTYLKCLGINYFDSPGSNNNYSMIFGLMNPPTGTQTFTVTGQSTFTSANSVAYNNVSGFDTPVYSNGSGTSMTLTDPGVDAGMVVSVFASRGPSVLTNYSQWTRHNFRDGNTYPLLIGDAPGGIGLTFSATNSDTSNWGGIGLSLLPQSAAPTGIVYDGMGTSSSLTGYASISFSHVATANAFIILDICADRDNTLTNVQYAGQNMTLQGSVRFPGYSGNAGVWRYTLANAPSGLSTVTATLSVNSYFTAQTIGYTGVSSAAAPTTTFGTSSAPSQSVTCNPGQLIVQSIGSASATKIGIPTGGTNLIAANWSGESLVINQATASTTFAGSTSLSNWGAIASVLSRLSFTADSVLAITASPLAVGSVGQFANTTQAITATPTGIGVRNAMVDSTLAVTASRTSNVTWALAANVAQAITASPTSIGSYGAVAAVTQTITANRLANVTWAAKAAALQQVTASPAAEYSRGQPASATQSITAIPDSTGSRGQTVESTETITVSTDAIGSRGQDIDSPLVVTADLLSMVTWQGWFDAAQVITASDTANAIWALRANAAQQITASYTALASYGATGNALLPITASPLLSNVIWDAQALSDLIVTASTPTIGSRWQPIDSTQAVTALLSGVGSRGQFVDSTLGLTIAALPAAISYGATGNALLVITASPTTVGALLDNHAYAALVVNAGRDANVIWDTRADSRLIVTAHRWVTMGQVVNVDAALNIAARLSVALRAAWRSGADLNIIAGLPMKLSRGQVSDSDQAIVMTPAGGIVWHGRIGAPLRITATPLADSAWDAHADSRLTVTESGLVIPSLGQSIDPALEVTADATGEFTQTMDANVEQAILALPDTELSLGSTMDTALPLIVTYSADIGEALRGGNFFYFYL